MSFTNWNKTCLWGVGNWPPAWKLKYLSARDTIKFQKMKDWMDELEYVNRRTPGYDGDIISGVERWTELVREYVALHGHQGEITTPMSLRTRWSKHKTAMEKLIINNDLMHKGKIPAAYPRVQGAKIV